MTGSMSGAPQVRSSVIPIPGLHAYSVKWSPFDADLAACVANQNYGVHGRGALVVLRRPPGSEAAFRITRLIQYKDALFDLSFSEVDPRVICAAGAYGRVVFFNVETDAAIGAIRGHSREVNSVEWNPTRLNQFVLSASWDANVNLVDPQAMTVVRSFQSATPAFAYSASWAPRSPGVFCSTSGDGTASLWDLRDPKSQMPVLKFQASPTEVLCVDWSKYDPNLLVTGSIDAAVALWDVRQTKSCQRRFFHKKAVRKVKFSPFFGQLFASVSYDFTTQIYNLAANRVELCLMNHSEFVYGLDWSVHKKWELMDCGWDENVTVLTLPTDKAPFFTPAAF